MVVRRAHSRSLEPPRTFPEAPSRPGVFSWLTWCVCELLLESVVIVCVRVNHFLFLHHSFVMLLPSRFSSAPLASLAPLLGSGALVAVSGV